MTTTNETTTGPIKLYVESASDYRITKVVGKAITTISLAEARELYDSGQVDDFNYAFARLVHNNFDLEAVKAFFSKMPSRRPWK